MVQLNNYDVDPSIGLKLFDNQFVTAYEKSVRKNRSTRVDQLENIWWNTEQAFNRRNEALPLLMQLLHPQMGNREFLETLCTDTGFCVRAGIRAGDFRPEALALLRAGAAELYY